MCVIGRGEGQRGEGGGGEARGEASACGPSPRTCWPDGHTPAHQEDAVELVLAHVAGGVARPGLGLPLQGLRSSGGRPVWSVWPHRFSGTTLQSRLAHVAGKLLQVAHQQRRAVGRPIEQHSRAGRTSTTTGPHAASRARAIAQSALIASLIAAKLGSEEVAGNEAALNLVHPHNAADATPPARAPPDELPGFLGSCRPIGRGLCGGREFLGPHGRWQQRAVPPLLRLLPWVAIKPWHAMPTLRSASWCCSLSERGPVGQTQRKRRYD